jgi:hypothetical protein
MTVSVRFRLLNLDAEASWPAAALPQAFRFHHWQVMNPGVEVYIVERDRSS